jgi:hypothetical protein
VPFSHQINIHLISTRCLLHQSDNQEDSHEDSDDDNSEGSEHIAPPSKCRVLGSTQTYQPSTSSICTMQKVTTVACDRMTTRSTSQSSRNSTNASGESIPTVSTPPSHTVSGHYVSTYQPALAGPSLLQPIFALHFDAYPYRRTTCSIREDGVISLSRGDTVEIILVANDWPQHKHQECRQGGYLGKGLEKYAFQVSGTHDLGIIVTYNRAVTRRKKLLYFR